MAYFRCVGGVGGGAVLTLTYSSEFYGETITATDGTKTVTKVAPSTGTMDITLPESGTWVVSATIDGQTYSTTVTVDIGYSATLFAVPNGSTVTPTDDIQTWLKCAGITDKTTYTTLADVLGDTDTLIALCADSNACDYMARSTNWASGVAADSTAMLIVGKYNYCAKALISNATWCEALAGSSYWQYVFDISVPLMTSDSAPSGVASSSGAYTNCPAYYAFDRNDSTQWQASGNSGTSSWLQYMFPDSVEIKLVEIRTFSGQNRDYIGTFQGSNDGSNWTDLASNITVGTTPSMTFIQNSDGYKYYRLQTVQHNWTADAPRAVIGTVQFYGRTDNANYIPLVPRMTSNTTPSGECFGSSKDSSSDYYKAFDKTDSDNWLASSGSTNNYIGYELTTPKVVKKVIARIRRSASTPARTFKVQKLIESNWTDVATFNVSGNSTSSVVHTDYEVMLDDSTPSSSYRLFCSDALYSVGNYGISVANLQFYSKQAHTLIHSAVEDNIFYMDDGSPVALCGIPVGDTIDVDLEAYKGQTLTLVSTVAKDPTNLSNDFSMNVRITPNITEIYLMPVGALYWWGHVGNVEDCISANGWSYGGSGITMSAPTHNTDNIYFETNTASIDKAFGSKSPVTGTVNAIIQAVSVNGGESVIFNDNTTKAVKSNWTGATTGITNTSRAKYSRNVTNSYPYVEIYNTGRSGKLYAMWYE